MKYNLLISEEAKLDIFDAFLWYENQREDLGFEFEASLENGFHVVVNNPLASQEKYDHVMVHFVERFPYGIHYIIDQDCIQVFGVFHTSLDPINWKKRI